MSAGGVSSPGTLPRREAGQALELFDMSYAPAIAVIMELFQLAGLLVILLVRRRGTIEAAASRCAELVHTATSAAGEILPVLGRPIGASQPVGMARTAAFEPLP